MSSMSVVVERAVSHFHMQCRVFANFQSTFSDHIQHAFTAIIIHFQTQTFSHLHHMHQYFGPNTPINPPDFTPRVICYPNLLTIFESHHSTYNNSF
jgi:hypothetical protein